MRNDTFRDGVRLLHVLLRWPENVPMDGTAHLAANVAEDLIAEWADRVEREKHPDKYPVRWVE